MKTAIIHDSLSVFGGAERVVQTLLDLYPQSHLYTAYYDPSIFNNFFCRLPQDRLHTSWAQGTSLMSHSSFFQMLSPLIWRQFNLENYDVVISSSDYLLCNLVRVNKPLHIQYVHSPPKNIFSMIPRLFLQYVVPYDIVLSHIYRRTLSKKAHVVTNSYHMQEILKQTFNINAQVVYPPVNIPKKPALHNKGSYYLTVSRLDNIKEIEILIRACSHIRAPLKIIGRGTDERYIHYLYKIAGPTVEFLGFLNDEAIRRLYINAIAFLFSPRAEDFGIAPVEAMAYGVPVIGYYGGGLKETVIEGKTGQFFYEYTKEAVIQAIQTFDPKKFSVNILYQHAAKFSNKKFKGNIERYINAVMSEKMR